VAVCRSNARPFSRLPGVEGAHEKGGVEGEVGRLRRWHCVPMPVVDSIEELNLLFAAADAKDDHRRVDNRTHTVGHDFAFEKTLLRPLPAGPFPTWLTLTPHTQAVSGHAGTSTPDSRRRP
jgi:hypothetical protein